MQSSSAIKVQGRDRAGKGAARATRRNGLIPGVIYGGKTDATLIAIDPAILRTIVYGEGFKTKIFELEIDGKIQRSMAMDVQIDPVSDKPVHVDFRRIDKDSIVRVPIPVRFINQAASPGIKVGGVLNIVRHDIDVRGKPDELPTHIDVDLTGLEIGDSVHINALALPKGIKPTIARNFTICSIAPPTTYVEEAVAAPTAAAEGAAPAEGAAAAGAAPGAAPGAAAGGDKGAAKGAAAPKAAAAAPAKKK
jgi:large subunit ribosomal protein L25